MSEVLFVLNKLTLARPQECLQHFNLNKTTNFPLGPVEEEFRAAFASCWKPKVKYSYVFMY